MTITSDSMKEFVLSNPKIVIRKELADNMYLLKYKRKVFYDNLWNEHLEECRGTIVDKDFNIISLPFRKIYNYGIESRAPRPSLDTEVTAYRKVNGFMVAMTYYKGEVLVSTTGNIEGLFPDRAKEFLTDALKDYVLMYRDYTHLFECVHRDDPHIIPEFEGLYYLGKRLKKWGSAVTHTDSEVDGGCPSAFWVPPLRMTLGKLIERVKNNKQEGFVFYTDSGISAKFKTPYYLTQKFLARNTDTSKLMKSNVKNYVDEEYYPLVDHVQANIEEFTLLDEQSRLAWIRNYLETKCVLG